jgi:RNA polymerase sigma-70 factor (ECF subfamily)
MSPADDRSSAAADLERDRFERCFREHYPSVLAFAVRRIADRETAKDAAAETFAVAWRRRDRIPDPALPWLYAVARRVIANQYRSARRRGDLGGRLEHEAGAGAAGGDPADSLGRRDAFAVAFGRLTESEREVLRLIAWDGLSTGEAARAYGCSPGAFRVRLHRARHKLAKQLRAAGHLADEPRHPAPVTAKEID